MRSLLCGYLPLFALGLLFPIASVCFTLFLRMFCCVSALVCVVFVLCRSAHSGRFLLCRSLPNFQFFSPPFVAARLAEKLRLATESRIKIKIMHYLIIALEIVSIKLFCDCKFSRKDLQIILFICSLLLLLSASVHSLPPFVLPTFRASAGKDSFLI